jgi:hypothetical protein
MTAASCELISEAATAIILFLLITPGVHLIHELGHAIMVLRVGWQVKQIRIGGQFSVSWRWKSVLIQFGLPPYGGACKHERPATEGHSPQLKKLIAIYSAGTLTTSALIALVYIPASLSYTLPLWADLLCLCLLGEQLFQFLPASTDGKMLRFFFRLWASSPRSS